MIQPLTGKRVIDFSHGFAGPLCGYQLGLLGAEVIKVERPGTGDNFRERGSVFDASNAGKRSTVVDLAADDAAERVRALVESADIVVHNFRPRIALRVGLDREGALATNPSLVLCSITGFGLRGPWEDRPAIEWTAQAASGLMDAYVDVDDHSQLGVLILDPFTGMLATQAILAAWLERLRTGEGQFVDVALLDAALIAQSAGVPAAIAGRQGPRGERPGVGRFRASDGAVYIGAVTPIWQERTFEALGIDADPGELRRGDDAAERIRAHIEAAIRGRTAADVGEVVSATGVPAAAVDSLTTILSPDHPLRPHMSLDSAIDRSGDTIPIIGSAVRYNGHSLAPRRPSPRLGEFDETSN